MQQQGAEPAPFWQQPTLRCQCSFVVCAQASAAAEAAKSGTIKEQLESISAKSAADVQAGLQISTDSAAKSLVDGSSKIKEESLAEAARRIEKFKVAGQKQYEAAKQANLDLYDAEVAKKQAKASELAAGAASGLQKRLEETAKAAKADVAADAFAKDAAVGKIKYDKTSATLQKALQKEELLKVQTDVKESISAATSATADSVVKTAAAAAEKTKDVTLRSVDLAGSAVGRTADEVKKASNTPTAPIIDTDAIKARTDQNLKKLRKASESSVEKSKVAIAKDTEDRSKRTTATLQSVAKGAVDATGKVAEIAGATAQVVTETSAKGLEEAAKGASGGVSELTTRVQTNIDSAGPDFSKRNAEFQKQLKETADAAAALKDTVQTVDSEEIKGQLSSLTSKVATDVQTTADAAFKQVVSGSDRLKEESLAEAARRIEEFKAAGEKENERASQAFLNDEKVTKASQRLETLAKEADKTAKEAEAAAKAVSEEVAKAKASLYN